MAQRSVGWDRKKFNTVMRLKDREYTYNTQSLVKDRVSCSSGMVHELSQKTGAQHERYIMRYRIPSCKAHVL